MLIRDNVSLRTDGVFDLQAVQLGLGESAPDFRPVDFVGVIQPTVNRHNVLHKNIDRHGMLVIFLIDCQRLLVQTVISGDLRNLASIVVLQLVDVANNLTLLGANSRQKEKVLQVLVVAEG